MLRIASRAQRQNRPQRARQAQASIGYAVEKDQLPSTMATRPNPDRLPIAQTTPPASSTSVHRRRPRSGELADAPSIMRCMLYDAVQRFVSAVCLPQDTILSLRPAADSTVPLDFINY